jgi:hypothetical protein
MKYAITDKIHVNSDVLVIFILKFWLEDCYINNDKDDHNHSVTMTMITVMMIMKMIRSY